MTSRLKRHLFGSAAPLLAAALAIGAPGGQARAVTAATGTTVGNATGVTFYLTLRDEAAAEAAARAIQTPGSPSYHRFLTVAQFRAAYAPTAQTVNQVINVLTQLGYTVDHVFANHLAIQADAPTATVQNTLAVRMRATTIGGRAGVVPSRTPTVPAALTGLVRDVGGLDTVHVAHPLQVHAAVTGPRSTPSALADGTVLTGGTPGKYLPADFAKRYDVDPIYRAGIEGRGSTIGIVTLANFYPSDAYTFWKDTGLAVSPSRITVVDVDGGTSLAPSDAAGAGETDIDVEESGGLAPAAKLRVYISQNNTNANYIDAFEAVASDNLADTVSSSWGQPELNFFPGVGQPDERAQIQDFHDVFLEMALQGQTVYVASGDSGSFDTVSECPVTSSKPASAANPICNAPYSVDSPANDPLVTAAGGTTTPFQLTLDDGATIGVAQERAWGWDYIHEQDPAIPLSALFSTGDGGGVSAYFAQPWYQDGVGGLTVTKPGQTLTENVGAGPFTVLSLPSGFAGRNMPDIATDADPESGYQFIDDHALLTFYGGTSFVAPQLNGVTALFVQALGQRVGQVNPALYEFGSLAANDIAAGDNWGYDAVKGFDNASGVGTLDATKSLIGLADLELGLY